MIISDEFLPHPFLDMFTHGWCQLIEVSLFRGVEVKHEHASVPILAIVNPNNGPVTWNLN
ncbi:MAG: hypothetical protein ACREBI_12095 [Nitrosotalea sp.]